MPDLVLYASGHGFGHAVRDAELLRALLDLTPDLRVEVRTEAPAWIFPSGVSVVRRSLDVGVVQPDTFRVEPAETLARYAAFVRAEAELIEREAAELRAGGTRLVVGDIPSAAFAVAARAGVPGIGVANFCWDWIYEPYVQRTPQHRPLLAHLRAQYGQAELLLRLPIHGDLSSFRRVADIPLIARRSTADRGETRRRLGLPFEAPLILLSWGGFGTAGLDWGRLGRLPYAFVSNGEEGGADRPPNLFLLPRHGYSYSDLLAACDGVVTKPGYGIVADCLANRVPVLYTPRSHWREEALLDGALEGLGRAVRLPRRALRRLDLGPYLERLLSLDRPWTDLRVDGAEVAARHLLALGGW